MGPAWFVDSVEWASTADEEIVALNNIDVRNETVVNEKYKNLISPFDNKTSSDSISLFSHEPDKLVYHTNTSGNKLAVFSEIYYPDWTIKIDGDSANYVEADYTLRAMIVPGGQHEIEFTFRPAYYTRANSLSMVFYYIIMTLILGLVIYSVYGELKKTKQVSENA